MFVRSLEGILKTPWKLMRLEEDPFLSLSLSVRHWRTGRLGVDPVFFSLRGYVNKLQGLYSIL